MDTSEFIYGMSGQKRKLVPLLPNTLMKRTKLEVEDEAASASGGSMESSAKSPRSSRSRAKPVYNTLQPLVTTKVINKNPPDNSDQPKPRHLKSCARCRKHKTKCNYVNTGPNPCSSCAKRGVTCQLEIVIPVKRSNIIKKLSDDVDLLKRLVDELLTKNNYITHLCKQKRLGVIGLAEIRDGVPGETDSSNDTDLSTDVITPPDWLDFPGPSTNDFDEMQMERIRSFESTSTYISVTTACTTPSSEHSEDGGKNYPPIFKLSDLCSYTEEEISCYFQEFNQKFLPYVPIMSPLEHPTAVFNSSELIFWTVVYVTSANAEIEAQFIRKELTKRCWAETPRDISIIQSIIIMAAFPIKTVEEINIQNDLNTSIFLQLEFAKDLSSQIGLGRSTQFSGEFSRLMQDKSLQDEYRYNIWCLLFILGHLYGFRLGLKWNFNIDYILEFRRSLPTYVGRLLNIVILQTTVLDTLIYDLDSSSHLSKNPQLLKNTLSLWMSQLQKFKDVETENNVLVLISLLAVIFELFEPSFDDTQRSQDINIRTMQLCEESFQHISELDVQKSPMFVKLTLEFISLVALKMAISPFNGGSPNSELFVQIFRKLTTLCDFNDTKPILNVEMETETSFNLNNSAVELGDLSLFKTQLMQGLFLDLKHSTQSSKTNIGDFQSLEKYFVDHNLRLDDYRESLTKFKEQVDMTSIYSSALIRMEIWGNVKLGSPSINNTSLSPIPSIPNLYNLSMDGLGNISGTELEAALSPDKTSDTKFASILDSMEMV
ncbi:hypothetical protein FOA43_004708 [Brettanomyces nanus]|uniref:Zn(2)-C6 fungal-type domain-containing protein n=1 Tax=Eeniella nana TaxID=13502 RepID=A0A875RQK7_EENNA|nr:uncharacterized protein FOA43_004708 [Brettanomyces nanus]QPG77300.1 hypothetical protein FOA43_004708 [Brettanomyces nanus]